MKLITFTYILFTCFSISCTTKHACLTPAVGMDFSNNYNAIPDSAANIVQYQKGSNFTTVIATSNGLPLASRPSGTDKYLSFPLSTADMYHVYDYDWKITLLPSGKEYRITNFSHDNNSQKTSGPVKDNCINTVNCTVNGITQTITGLTTDHSSADVQIVINYAL